MSWLGDRVRGLINLFNSDEHKYTEVIVPEEGAPVKTGISEPILTFATEVRVNPSRFELHKKVEHIDVGYHSYFSEDYLVIDKANKKSFSFTLIDHSGWGDGVTSIHLTTTFTDKCVQIKTEDLGWVTPDERKYLLDLVQEVDSKRVAIKNAKDKRKQANQRRRMRKLYETN